MRGLKTEILAHGLRAPIHVIPGNGGAFILVDGHRRVSIALELGWHKIPAIVHAVADDPVTLWSSLNSKTRSVNAYEWMVAWHLTGGTMKLQPSVQGHVTKCLRVFGRNGIAYLVEHQASPTIAQSVDQLWEKMEQVTLTDKITKRDVGFWLVRHKLGQTTQQLLKITTSKRALLKVRTRFARDIPFQVADIILEQKRDVA